MRNLSNASEEDLIHGYKGSKWEIKDEELQRELKDGAQLISYSSSDPLS